MPLLQVDLRPIITSLIDRLAMHILNQSDRALKYTAGPTDIYHVLYNHVIGVFTERGHVHISNVLAIMSSLARFALRTYNDQPQYVDEVLLYCHQAMEKADKTYAYYLKYIYIYYYPIVCNLLSHFDLNVNI